MCVHSSCCTFISKGRVSHFNGSLAHRKSQRNGLTRQANAHHDHIRCNINHPQSFLTERLQQALSTSTDSFFKSLGARWRACHWNSRGRRHRTPPDLRRHRTPPDFSCPAASDFFARISFSLCFMFFSSTLHDNLFSNFLTNDLKTLGLLEILAHFHYQALCACDIQHRSALPHWHPR